MTSKCLEITGYNAMKKSAGINNKLVSFRPHQNFLCQHKPLIYFCHYFSMADTSVAGGGGALFYQQEVFLNSIFFFSENFTNKAITESNNCENDFEKNSQHMTTNYLSFRFLLQVQNVFLFPKILRLCTYVDLIA